MIASEIIAELPRLSVADSAEIQIKLLELLDPGREIPRPLRIYSPRLARPEQSKDFVQRIAELAPDAAL